MALTRKITCAICGQESWVTYSGICPSVCQTCANATAAENKKAEMAKLAKLPIEERLALIESLLYDAPWEQSIRMQNMRF